MVVLFGSVLVSICAVIFFSGVESAFLSLDKLRFEMERERKDNFSYKILAYFFQHSTYFISAMLVGKILSAAVYAILSVQLLMSYEMFGMAVPHSVILGILITLTVFLYILVEDFIPLVLFKIAPCTVLRVCSLLLCICYVVLFPIARVILLISAFCLRLFGIRMTADSMEKAFCKVDLDYFVQHSIEDILNEKDVDTEVQIFQNALDFSNIKVRDCIVPRTEMVAVDVSISLSDLRNRFVESGKSKIIVYKGSIDNVVGYIHSSEMFRNPDCWQKHVKQIPIVPETMAAHKLMRQFMQLKKTMALVVDEFGGVSGIVSLEDLVEEIFGEIEDEHDNTSYVCKQIAEHEYVLSARLEIGKVNETFGLNLPESDDYLTIGGLILNVYQSFPKLNETIKIGVFQFKVIKISATKIDLVRLKVLE